MTIRQRLRERYLPYHDRLDDPPKEPIRHNWADFREYLDGMSDDARTAVFAGQAGVSYMGIPIVLDHDAPPFNAPE